MRRFCGYYLQLFAIIETLARTLALCDILGSRGEHYKDDSFLGYSAV
jgi:hypothetical protein